MNVVALENIDVVIRGARILSDVSLSVPERRVVAIVGANGAGKTTLLDVISRVVSPVRGTVQCESSGRVYQSSPLPATLTVAEVVALVTVSRAEALRVIQAFGLTDHISLFVSELSTGMRRILDLAVATCGRPKVLLLDEPSSGLAQEEVAQLASLIRAFRDETGAAVVLVEHDRSLVEHVADEVVVLRHGVIEARGTVAKMLAKPRSGKTPRIRSVADASVASAFAKLFGETRPRA
ncbi:MAG: hypothetical protein NVSMB57_08680 [Actinomycetota bacterium]